MIYIIANLDKEGINNFVNTGSAPQYMYIPPNIET